MTPHASALASAARYSSRCPTKNSGSAPSLAGSRGVVP